MTGSTVVPGLRYRDAAAAIDFLCDAFGFERQLVVSGEGGAIAHAQLTLGGGMVMLGSAPPGEPVAPADATGVYIVAPDPDEVFARAKAAGAAIVAEPEDQGHGGRSFRCRDPEGYTWNVGSYDPWAVA